jgi:hypothetical protein
MIFFRYERRNIFYHIYTWTKRKIKLLFIEQNDDDANKSDVRIKVDRVGMWWCSWTFFVLTLGSLCCYLPRCFATNNDPWTFINVHFHVTVYRYSSHDFKSNIHCFLRLHDCHFLKRMSKALIQAVLRKKDLFLILYSYPFLIFNSSIFQGWR